MMKRIFACLSLALALGAGGVALSFPVPAFAQIDAGLTEVGETVVLPETDPRTIAVRIINVSLGVLAIIMVVLIVYAGFVYMTSAGNAEKTATAVKIIRNAIIGLIIILMSWGITRFVIERLLQATGGGGGVISTGPGGGGGGGGGFGGGAGPQPFAIVGITPTGPVETRKVVVKIVFTKNVSEASAQQSGMISVRQTDGTEIGGDVRVEGRVVQFTPGEPCPSPNEDRRCLAENTDYRVIVGNTLEDVSGQQIVCGGFSPSCEAQFRTGTSVDITPPDVTITQPLTGQSVPADALVDVNAFVRDTTGVAYVSFQDGTDVIDAVTPTGNSPTQFDARVLWNTAGLAPGGTRVLTATAYDVDSGVNTSVPVSVVVRPNTCFNGVQDGTETGVDCGGSPGTPEFCGVCAGGSCTENTQCASGTCSQNVCVAQPIITSVTPGDGAIGSYITIRGVNFGTVGQVIFLGAQGGAAVAASSPSSCLAEGIATWSPTQVVVEVPVGAQSGPLQLTNALSGLSDTTHTVPEPFILDFLVTDTVRPAICGIAPASGNAGQAFRLIGKGFGAAVADILFDDRSVQSTSWADTEVRALIPNVADQAYAVRVRVGNAVSNAVAMAVTSRASSANVPVVANIAPAAGPVGAYVTLSGTGFGDTTGQVFFRDVATGREVLADTNFPAQCSAVFWRDNAIVVKVPPSYTRNGTGAVQPGAYAVRVVSARAGVPPSEEVNFSINTSVPTPGICAVVPSVAPVGSSVTIHGERLTSGPGQVTFAQNRHADGMSWSETQVGTTVPAGAVTGPVIVTPANGVPSNGFPFQVRSCLEAPNACAGAEECCADGACRPSGQCVPVAEQAMFAWQISSGTIPRAPRVVESCQAGDIPSPSPWIGRPGGDAVCVNAAITIRFTTPIEPASVAPSARSVQLYACTSDGSDPCATRSPVSLAVGSPDLQPAGATEDYVTLSPSSALTTNTTYEVVLTTAVRGLGDAGTFMEEQEARCGAGNAYCFQFRTRASEEPCALGLVTVTPNPFTVLEQGELPADHVARPIAANDSCTVLQCTSYDWEWSASDSRASVTNRQAPGIVPPIGACRQRVTAYLETGSDPVNIRAATAGVTGSADLYISFVPPKVERFGPQCDEACINAAAWAVLSTEIDPATIHAGTVTVQPCRNENCIDVEPPLTLPDDAIQLIPSDSSDPRRRQITIAPMDAAGTPLLAQGRFYRVTLHGGTPEGIRSLSGVPLAGLNDPFGFSWTFRVRPGDAAQCSIDRVALVPLEKIEHRVGARQEFVASLFSVPDTCSAQGQRITAVAGMSWSSSRPDVAKLLDDGQIDTGAPLPAGCNDRCVLSGATGQDGQTARCGNGTVETTHAAYCQNGVTAWNDRCIVLPPGSRGGEECDDGNTDANDACNNSCRWNPVTPMSLGGTCGNSRIDRGEACDMGRVCRGAPADSDTPEGTDCTENEAQCIANGGVCITRVFRGCSATCRSLGSSAGGSTCGNGDIADGEDCDDGNTANGDGCSAQCLHEGSSQTIYALCGNGVREPGEACERDDPGFGESPGCNAVTCLRTGVPPCTSVGQELCCGNGNANEPGKDCDDGSTQNGDGCSAQCLWEGSSIAYAEPSFCSDGVLGIGEQCESPGPRFVGDALQSVRGGDGLVDARQVAEVVGRGQADERGRMTTDIGVAISDQGRSAQAVYGLQCGFSEERFCSADGLLPSSETGLTSSGCCDARPRLVETSPINRAGDTLIGRPWAEDPFPQGVCRNVLISGSFNVEMDESSLTGNFMVAKRVAGDVCPQGLQDVTASHVPEVRGIRGFAVRTWRRVVTFFRPSAARAEVWCAGAVPGTLSTETVDGKTTFAYTLATALEPRTEYRVRFQGDTSSAEDPLGDNANPANRVGIRSSTGVVVAPDAADEGLLTWHFTTGDVLCLVNEVRVRDLTTEHPNFFAASEEQHPFVAQARSFVNGRPLAVTPIAGVYAWAWGPWAFSNPALIRLDPESVPDTETFGVSSRDVISRDANGSGYLSAHVRITADTVSPVSTQNQVVQGSELLTVSLCENPWPSRAETPFRDTAGSPSLAGTPFENGPFYQFAVSYCRDAGAPGPNEDLPALVINAVPPNAVDSAQGVLRQYLFTFREQGLRDDAIGIRIANNPLHLSPLDWYYAKGFSGNPQPLTVDGYQAIRDGRTVYVSAVNTEGPGSDLYSNIYLVSYNEGAAPLTRQLYDALLTSLIFNINVTSDTANACRGPSGALDVAAGGVPVACSADWECKRFGDDHRCANFKGKVQRDLMRLADVQQMAKSLVAAKAVSGSYPTLPTGSYLPGMTTSRWPSWNEAFRTALAATSPTPVDPVNRFITCGRCTIGGSACVTDADCGSGSVCATEEGFDPATCWQAPTEQFLCPDGGSHVYRYRAVQAGQGFDLATTFEIAPPDPQNLSDRWWKPVPLQDIRQCITPATRGNFCLSDADCRACPAGNCTGVPVTVGACQAIGGHFQYTDVCRDETYGATGTCGDGVVNGGEACETVGPTATRQTSCTAASGDSGEKQQRCNACAGYVDDASQPGCFDRSVCGNGRVDEDEICDDGAQNGAYGRCNAFCTGYDGYCGDGEISPGEVCDNGSANTDYCAPGSCTFETACNLSCTGKPLFCGNGRVDAGEQCDGPLTTTKSTCVQGTNIGQPCDTDNQCGSGGKCGGLFAGDGACAAGFIRTRPCSATCRLAGAWGMCERAGRCGDGIINGGEVCDDGNQVNEDACTNTCQANTCGDGYLLKGVEECDMGDPARIVNGRNGQACTTAEYGSTCTSCSLSCKFQLTQGGYCGDGRRAPGSAEQCDKDDFGQQGVPDCKAFGFDYLAPNLNRIQCTPTCELTGCARCGAQAGNGALSGTLLDTLFQQPVAGAAITLLYRGLTTDHVAITDEDGMFQFAGLDDHDGCNQYELVVDAYGDNVRTPNFDESIRGGYASVRVGPFEPTSASLRDVVVAAGQGVAVSKSSAGGTIAQINMVPKLRADEYVVQLWWEPKGGYDKVLKDFQASLASDPTGSGYYGSPASENELHDLVIRVPSPFSPGATPGSCSLPQSPVAYQGNGRNTSVLNADGSVVTIGAASQPGMSGVDRADSNFGMLSCTNKIRATASRTCSGTDVPQNLLGKVPCTPASDGTDNACRDRYGFSDDACAGPPEASRSGDVRVLSGGTGAYLFCYHPEWQGTAQEAQRAAETQCTNFILPPQSVFIRANSGQYDILVSKYRLFADPSHDEVGVKYQNKFSIREWLWNRKAEIRIYGQSGLVETVSFRDADNAASAPRTDGWAPWDGVWSCLTQEMLDIIGNNRKGRVAAIEALDTVSVSPVWTPVSINASARSIVPWIASAAPGYAGADYRYFSDMLHRTHRGNADVSMGPGCAEETCQPPDGPTGGLVNCTGVVGGSTR